MSTIIEGIAAYKVTDNDNVIDKAYFQMEYDGEDFNMTGVKNNQLVIMSMTNDEIMELLSRKADPRPIEDRLQIDFGKKIVVKPQSKKSRSRSRSKKAKSASSKKTRSKRKSSSSKSPPTVTKTPAYKRD
jgi:hypothetical protein